MTTYIPRARLIKSITRRLFFIVIIGASTACSVEDNNQDSPTSVDGVSSTTSLSGSVGDGPVTQAQIVVTDDNGDILVESISDITANYGVNVPTTSNYPLLITATGGTDMVTGAEPDFTMVSVAMSSFDSTVNVNPFSTLIVKIAQAMDGSLTTLNLEMATQYTLDQLNFGLDPALVPNPITSTINDTNVAAIIKASEALGEVIRRTQSALLIAGINMSGDDIIDAIAVDLTDGKLDGRGLNADARIAATTNIVSAQVLVELIANQLNVSGSDATMLMDSAISVSMPGATMQTSDVVITEGVLTQARVAVTAAQTVNSNPNLAAVAVILAGLTGNSLAADIQAELPANANTVFDEVISQVVLADSNQLELVNASVRSGSTVSTPPDATLPPTIDPAPTPDPTPTPSPNPTPGAFEFSASTYSVGEGDQVVNITINRVGGSDGVATVDWRTITFNGYGTADWANDYGTFPWTTLTFLDGETSKVEQITILQDTVAEGDETFSVLVQNPTGGATLASQQSTVVTIVDDDTATTPISPTPTPAPGGSGNDYPSDEVLTAATSIKPVGNPNSTRPGYRLPQLDSTFNSYVTRITDSVAFNYNNLRHEYSKTQPWNSDGSLIKIKGFIIDGKTYERLGTYTRQQEERWSHTDPNIMYGVRGNQFKKFDVRTGQWTTIRTFDGYDNVYFGPYQGDISIDDKYVALAARRNGETTPPMESRHAIIYDIENNTIVAEKQMPRPIKWISMSQSGQYAVVRWWDTSGPRVQSYDRNLNFVTTLAQNSAHGDLGFLQDGTEVYVQMNGLGFVTSYRLSDGFAQSQLSRSIGYSNGNGHVSCRNIQRPGYCYIDIREDGGSGEIIAIKLDGSGTVERFVHHRSTEVVYDAQVKAVVSPDGTKVMFVSDWDGAAPELNSYVVQMVRPQI